MIPRSKYQIDKDTDCWNWLGAVSSDGYAVVYDKGRRVFVRRVVWETFNGPISKETAIRPSCGNKLCINSQHLFAEGSEAHFEFRQQEFLNRLVKKKSGCWEWPEAHDGGGYGYFSFKGVQVKTHRFSYELHHGSFDSSFYVLHHCDNPPCCNPAHLYLGDHATNMADKVKRKRCNPNPLIGSQSPAAKLNEEAIIEIRKDRRCHSLIASQYKVNQSVISRIKNLKAWKHVRSVSVE